MRRLMTREQRMTVVYGILSIVLVLVVLFGKRGVYGWLAGGKQ